jgi:hypothetical protein
VTPGLIDNGATLDAFLLVAQFVGRRKRPARAGIDRGRSDKDCDYKTTHDFLAGSEKFRQHHSGTALADKNGQAR